MLLGPSGSAGYRACPSGENREPYSQCIQVLEGYVRLEETLGLGERLELFVGGNQPFVGVVFVLGIEDDLRKETGPMEVEVRKR
jgi:hypothetical protein